MSLLDFTLLRTVFVEKGEFSVGWLIRMPHCGYRNKSTLQQKANFLAVTDLELCLVIFLATAKIMTAMLYSKGRREWEAGGRRGRRYTL